MGTLELMNLFYFFMLKKIILVESDHFFDLIYPTLVGHFLEVFQISSWSWSQIIFLGEVRSGSRASRSQPQRERSRATQLMIRTSILERVAISGWKCQAVIFVKFSYFYAGV